MKAHSIKVPRTAHYYTLGEISKATKYFCLACHGYGQQAKKLIHKFKEVELKDTYVMAPQGLSSFYWKGFTGDVGSSWMTRENRLDEIADYSNYLSTLYAQTTALLPDDCIIILLGFSQGCATQMRWMMRAFPKYHHLILWAGTIPEDIDYHPHLPYFDDKKIHYVYGTQDEFITPKRFTVLQELIAEAGLQIASMTSFEGPHHIDRPTLKKVFDRIRKGG